MSIADYAKDIFNNPGKYAKFWIAFAGFLLNLIVEYFPEAKWVQPVIALVTAGGVITVPNKKAIKP